ncbi:hypothetical protein QN345_00590 [Cryobacterium sp. 10I1]|uniref:hypothetical protein n=1 Tax=Cryobacterium sp. 10I1 TaxID=3048578 RepID=UPI002B222900|nr:hypothetical protein [Cryobacterium sp. 10I1]MEB0303837.1 hypothetical protein [Cryobacterium sp. 10I1]
MSRPLRTSRSRRVDRIVSTVVFVLLAVLGVLMGYLIGRDVIPAIAALPTRPSVTAARSMWLILAAVASGGVLIALMPAGRR